MNKKGKLTVAAVCLLVLVIGLIVFGLSRASGGTEPVGPTGEPERVSDSVPSNTENGGAQTAAPTQSGAESTGAPDSPPAESSTSGGAWQETITLPYSIPGSELTVCQVSAYSGAFLEDGSDQDVSNITAIILKNEGSKPVEYASVTLIRSDGAALRFEASAILPGASVVIQEKNKTAYQESGYSGCTADVAEAEKLERSEDLVKVEETGSGSLEVTNLTSEEIPCVRIFYKLYMSEEDAYIGGITYMVKITGLAPGAPQTVTPSHYAAGYSQVVMVRTYDTAE